MKAHGQHFADKAAADARIAEINEEIFRYGVSDGRVTEILCIIDMLQKEGLEEAPEQPKPAYVFREYKAPVYYVVDETDEIIISSWNNEMYANERADECNSYQRMGPKAHEFGVWTRVTESMLEEYENSGRWW